MFKQIILLITLFILNAYAFEMNMETLYLTAGDKNSVVSTMFDAYGMNYKTIQLPTNELVLENNKVALYNSIVIEDATKEILASIKPQIEEYQMKYKVRVAYLNCEPDESFGFSDTIKTTDSNDKYELTNEGLTFANKYKMNGNGVSFNSTSCVYNYSTDKCDTYYHYRVPMNNNDVNQLVIPILKYKDLDYYAGFIIKNNTNDIESIHFYLSYIESLIAYFTSHLWISWVNYGIIDGFRRLYFGIQIDDFFINNPFNFTKGTEYRSSIQDLKNIAQWQKEITEKRMPYGSSFKIELAFNGMYVLIISQHKEHISQSYTDPHNHYTYVFPMSEEGTHKWPDNIDSNWDDSVLRNGDKLYDYIAKNPEVQDNFYWLTHTFSHHNLNSASFHDADVEIGLNIKLADEPYLGMYNRPCFSQNSIVCPEISGMHNGHTLEAFKKNRIYYGVGDNSRPDVSPDNYYFPLITNQTTSNFDGFYIIPRQPTEMYWDCSLPDQILTLYKERGGDQDIDWTNFVRRDIENSVKNFLKLRHDPYMFHEGNLRNEDVPEIDINGVRGKFGLMQEWVEKMVAEIKKYLDWPLITKKMDDLAQTYILRVQQRECEPKYTMVIEDKTLTIKEIKVSSTKGSCKVPLFAIRNTQFDKSTVSSIEQIGNEPPTAWIDATNNKVKSVKFVNKLQWNNDDYTGDKNDLDYLMTNDAISSSSLLNHFKYILLFVISILFMNRI
ncbi:hypothetical protein BCR32DRAFT_328962 [Anaeromyces robustus]|uniref:Uncharacterized protein n=1 Tax=Anaeromyces robustus TaxID=1754192 RepID=A0A1Y1WVL2_9FUNG|nr:hypothetical protein BCR32DRAFT_328962 [Anaeromyces robustus]|eukprot:ORX77348.1 hypothetical protein BCR32DRAFT_328962 [Anaeromyces robustus]